MNYVNFLMRQVNEKTDNIYESLMDKDYPVLHNNCGELIEMLLDILKSIEPDA